MRRVSVLVIVAFFAAGSYADTWRAAEEATYVSADGRWALTVTPKDFEHDQAYGAKALLRHDGVEVTRWRLLNPYAPLKALVANDGTVVTFDDWARLGYGDRVVVIYRSDGTLVRKFGLADLLVDEDIERLRRSVSSIHWAGEHRIDGEARQLVLQIDGDGKMHELRLDLVTGKPLQPKRGLLSHWRVDVGPPELEASRCAGMTVVTGEELLAHAIDAQPAAYPEIARKARVGGSVQLELIVGEGGGVDWVAALQPLPFGVSESAEAAARRWKFRPFLRDGTPATACGRVTMTFGLVPPGHPAYGD